MHVRALRIGWQVPTGMCSTHHPCRRWGAGGLANYRGVGMITAGSRCRPIHIDGCLGVLFHLVHAVSLADRRLPGREGVVNGRWCKRARDTGTTKTSGGACAWDVLFGGWVGGGPLATFACVVLPLVEYTPTLAVTKVVAAIARHCVVFGR